MKDETAVALVAMVIIGILEGYALYLGIDGTYLSMVVGAIASIVSALLGAIYGIKKAKQETEA